MPLRGVEQLKATADGQAQRELAQSVRVEAREGVVEVQREAPLALAGLTAAEHLEREAWIRAYQARDLARRGRRVEDQLEHPHHAGGGGCQNWDLLEGGLGAVEPLHDGLGRAWGP